MSGPCGQRIKLCGRYDLYTGYNMVQITNILMGGGGFYYLDRGRNRQQYAKRIDGYPVGRAIISWFDGLDDDVARWLSTLASIPVGQSLEDKYLCSW